MASVPPAAAGPPLPLPPRLPAPDRARLEEIVRRAFASTRMQFEPYPVRPEVFEYLLDHPEFATHVTRALKAARYRIWSQGHDLWLDDGWGVRGTFSTLHAERGLRLLYAQGAYQASVLPDIRGRAVVALTYGFTPDGQGHTLVATTLTAFVQLDSSVLHTLGQPATPLVQKKADREARQLLKVFARVSHAIADNPADVYRRVRERPDVPKAELAEFRRLLGVP